MQATLRLLHRTANMQQIKLRSDTLIGRAPECQLKIASNQVSRRHCRILIRKSTVLIEDLKSSNGTLVNGVMVTIGQLIPLSEGDQITIGPAVFLLEINNGQLQPLVNPIGDVISGALQSLSSTLLGAASSAILRKDAKIEIEPDRLSQKQAASLALEQELENHLPGESFSPILSAVSSVDAAHDLENAIPQDEPPPLDPQEELPEEFVGLTEPVEDPPPTPDDLIAEEQPQSSPSSDDDLQNFLRQLG